VWLQYVGADSRKRPRQFGKPHLARHLMGERNDRCFAGKARSSERARVDLVDHDIEPTARLLFKVPSCFPVHREPATSAKDRDPIDHLAPGLARHGCSKHRHVMTAASPAGEDLMGKDLGSPSRAVGEIAPVQQQRPHHTHP
jgi:hypothetical protein